MPKLQPPSLSGHPSFSRSVYTAPKCNWSSLFYYRFEGEDNAIIIDIIYQSKTNYDEKTKGDKKQYDKLQDEIKELVEKLVGGH